MNEKDQAADLIEVEVTNYFSGGDRKRQEILARPEVCKCSCDCGSWCTIDPISSFLSAWTNNEYVTPKNQGDGQPI